MTDDKKESKVEIPIYDMYRQLYSEKVDPLTKEQLTQKMASIGSWFSTNPACNHYTLMCREIYDFTVLQFHNMNYNRGMELVQEILENRGQILDIGYAHEQNAYECWIKDHNGEVQMYMLFESDWIVVDVE